MTVLHGDCLSVMPTLEANSVDAIVSDPPYGLSFMGKEWDHGVPGVEFWREALRVAKPGAHLVAFGGSRTYHRLACAIEDAGWEIRDCLSWLYGSGFPKSLDIGKAMDKVNGEMDRALRFCAWFRESGVTRKQATAAMVSAGHISANGTMAGHFFARSLAGQPAVPTPAIWETLRPLCGDVPAWVDELVERHEAERKVLATKRDVGGRTVGIIGRQEATEYAITAPATDLARQWQGWGTALKPAWEPIILARKPLAGTVAANVAQYGTGGLNVDGCRIAGDPFVSPRTKPGFSADKGWNDNAMQALGAKMETAGRWPANVVLDEDAASLFPESRFFYTAKVSRREREAGLEGMPERVAERYGEQGQGPTPQQTPREHKPAANFHPTVKPIALMRWLCRLVTPPNGLILDPFTGSGSTGCAAVLEGFRFVGIEREAEYVEIAEKRIAYWATQRETQEPDLFTEASR